MFITLGAGEVKGRYRDLNITLSGSRDVGDRLRF